MVVHLVRFCGGQAARSMKLFFDPSHHLNIFADCDG